MKLVRQDATFTVGNVLPTGEHRGSKHGHLLPNTVRAVIVGSSGSGKTNLMVALLLEPNGLRYRNVYICSKSLLQDKYNFLRDVYREIPDIGYFTFHDTSDFSKDVKSNSIVVFDDVACSEQTPIMELFSMGRHKEIDPFYLCQTYAKIPKHLVRDNENIIFIFRQDDLNLKHIYDDHVNTDMTYDQFKELCRHAWGEDFGFVTIVKEKSVADGRYRKGLDTYAQ